MRSLLMGLALACLVPGVGGAVVLFYVEYQRGQEQLEHNTLQTARVVLDVVNSQLLRAQAIAHTLASSDAAAKGDFASFHAQATEVLQRTGIAAYVALHDVAGRNLVNTLGAAGESFPVHGNTKLLRQVFESGKSMVSDLYLGSVTGRPRVSVYVPVHQAGRVIYAVNVGIDSVQLSDILRQQHLPPDWLATVFDRDGTVIARTLAPEKYVGQKGRPELLAQFKESPEGALNSTSMEGIKLFSVYSSSQLSGWNISIGIPRRSLEADLRRGLAVLALAIGVLFSVGLSLAWLMGGRLAHSMQALIPPALALGRGERAPTPVVHTREAHAVITAIGTAAEILRRRSAELQRANAVLQENERTLEERVRKRTSELLAAQQDLEVFAYAASHDLKGPIRRIHSLAGLLESNNKTRLDEDSLRLLGMVQQNALRLGHLVDDLLSHARVTQQAMDLRPVDLSALVSELLDAKEEDVQASGAVVKLDLPAVLVIADSRGLSQAVNNLVDNALKYSAQAAPPIIEISGEFIGGRFRLKVKDNGIGFDMAHHDKIFEIFKRLHSYDRFAGTGVGLALVKRAVERMGGKVWAESAPGHGATFFLELPVAQAMDVPRQA